LLTFYGVPPQTVETTDAPGFDWSRLFTEAGLDPADFHPTEPRWTPSQPFDERAAWEGHHPGQPDSPIRVEAAAFQGKPVSFQIVNPWTRPARDEQAQMGASQRAIQALIILIFFVILIGGAMLARHNLRLGRGDRRGAFRLAAFVLIAETVAWLTASHHVPNLSGEFGMFLVSLAYTLLLTSVLWLVYIAIEPFVRRRWPGIINSWNRLLAGDYGDPLVGRDLLLGALFGFASVLVSCLSVLVPQWLGMSATTPPATSLTGLEGTQYAAALLAAQAIDALIGPSVLLFLFLIFSIVLRRRWVAAGVLFLVITLLGAQSGEHPSIDWLFAMASAALTLFVLLRLGLLAAVFMQFFASAFYIFPMTTDFSAWYAGTTIVAVAVIVALVLYSFRTSLAGQRLFTGSLVED
jgi:serine/threonine-protein kinase